MSTIDKSQLFVRERVSREAALTRSGESAASIARRLGVTQRTITRYRARRRQQSTRKATT